MLVSAPEDITVPISTNLRFAPNLRKLAKKAVQTAKKKTGSNTFNGLHLRVEEDATSYLKRVCFLDIQSDEDANLLGLQAPDIHLRGPDVVCFV